LHSWEIILLGIQEDWQWIQSWMVKLDIGIKCHICTFIGIKCHICT